MAEPPERPCPSCAAALSLASSLVTCPRCDRDFAVSVEGTGADPYRGGQFVALTPAARPPPRGVRIRDLGARIRIRHADSSVAIPRAFFVAVLMALLLLVAARSPVFALLPLAIVTAFALVSPLGLREELALTGAGIGWRRTLFGVDTMPRHAAALADVRAVQVCEEGDSAFVQLVLADGGDLVAREGSTARRRGDGLAGPPHPQHAAGGKAGGPGRVEPRMGPDLSRPCPACGVLVALDAALVTCPSCDRDFSVAIAAAGPDPYRDAARVTLAPATRPPPAGAPLRDEAGHITIGRGRAGRGVGPVARGVGAAVVIGPSLLLRLERAPAQHAGLLAGLLVVWGALCLVVWALFALARRARREELWLEEGVIGWRCTRFGVGPERMAFLHDVLWVELRSDGPRAWVEVGFPSATWTIGRAQNQDAGAMAWLARRLTHAARPL
jgi:hypothetical protein